MEVRAPGQTERLHVVGEAVVQERGELGLGGEGGGVCSGGEAVGDGDEDLSSAAGAVVEDGRNIDHCRACSMISPKRSTISSTVLIASS